MYDSEGGGGQRQHLCVKTSRSWFVCLGLATSWGSACTARTANRTNCTAGEDERERQRQKYLVNCCAHPVVVSFVQEAAWGCCAPSARDRTQQERAGELRRNKSVLFFVLQRHKPDLGRQSEDTDRQADSDRGDRQIYTGEQVHQQQQQQQQAALCKGGFVPHTR